MLVPQMEWSKRQHGLSSSDQHIQHLEPTGPIRVPQYVWWLRRRAGRKQRSGYPSTWVVDKPTTVDGPLRERVETEREETEGAGSPQLGLQS
jgi:hypothetical protein